MTKAWVHAIPMSMFLISLLLFILTFSAQAAPFKVPSVDSIPKTTAGESILRGKAYLEQTYAKLGSNVRAKMNCTSCHINGGTTPEAGPFIAITTRFPQFSARDAKTEDLADRINDCFVRSMNGTALSKKSAAMKDMLNYMGWLSEGYKKGDKVEGTGVARLISKREPDVAKGKQIYQNKCAACHQPEGQGLFAGTDVIFPPLWGEGSFNIAAGMARLFTAAGFVKAKMPLGQGGSLSEEEALDVAAYFTRQPRPDYAKKSLDWPKGGKPADARY